MRYLPLGRMLASRGTVRESAPKRSSDNGTPARPAIAIRWITAFVDPPKAKTTVIAFSNDSSVKGDDGKATIRRPDATAIRGWSLSAAGIDAAPGIVTPSASTADVIVD